VFDLLEFDLFGVLSVTFVDFCVFEGVFEEEDGLDNDEDEDDFFFVVEGAGNRIECLFKLCLAGEIDVI